MREKSWFVDTVVLSNFAFADAVDLIIIHFGRNKLKITQEVYNETMKGTVAYPQLESIVLYADDRKIDKIELSSDERTEYYSLLQNLGSGEASCIAAAMLRGGTVITDDRVARMKCQERNIFFTGTIGILKACCLKKEITISQADSILKKMVSFGFYSPVSCISDIS